MECIHSGGELTLPREKKGREGTSYIGGTALQIPRFCNIDHQILGLILIGDRGSRIKDVLWEDSPIVTVAELLNHARSTGNVGVGKGWGK